MSQGQIRPPLDPLHADTQWRSTRDFVLVSVCSCGYWALNARDRAVCPRCKAKDMDVDEQGYLRGRPQRFARLMIKDA